MLWTSSEWNMDTSGSSKQNGLIELSKQLKRESVSWSVKRNTQIRKSTFGQRPHTSKSCDVLLSIPQLGPHCRKVCQVTMRTHWTCGTFPNPQIFENRVSHWLKEYETATAGELMVTQFQDTVFQTMRNDSNPTEVPQLFLESCTKEQTKSWGSSNVDTGVGDWSKSVPAGHF